MIQIPKITQALHPISVLDHVKITNSRRVFMSNLLFFLQFNLHDCLSALHIEVHIGVIALLSQPLVELNDRITQTVNILATIHNCINMRDPFSVIIWIKILYLLMHQILRHVFVAYCLGSVISCVHCCGLLRCRSLKLFLAPLDKTIQAITKSKIAIIL